MRSKNLPVRTGTKRCSSGAGKSLYKEKVAMKQRIKRFIGKLHVAAKRRGMNQKGFTLVEMLIVIALIALAAVIMFGVLGNSYGDASVKQSATKLGDDMRAVNDASQKYMVDKGSEATALSGAGTALVDSGYMTMIPVAPSSAGATPYAWDTSTYKGWSNAANNDTVVKSTITSTPICQKINELFAGLAAGAAVPGAIDYTKDLQCFGAASPYTVVKSLYVH